MRIFNFLFFLFINNFLILITSNNYNNNNEIFCSFEIKITNSFQNKNISFSTQRSSAVTTFRYCQYYSLNEINCYKILEYYSIYCNKDIFIEKYILILLYKLIYNLNYYQKESINIEGIIPPYNNINQFIDYINYLIFELPLYISYGMNQMDYYLISSSLDYTNSNDIFLEFGSYQGETIQIIQKYFLQHQEYNNSIVYGFDSFLGLPESWRDNYIEGSFNQYGNPPFNETKNIKWVIGYFNETISLFFSSLVNTNHLNNSLKNESKSITFIHIDCDLYSSTKFIFQSLLNYSSEVISRERCMILLFNELIGYEGYENHEIKALYEFYIELFQKSQNSQDKKEYVFLEMLPRQLLTIHQVVGFRLCIFS